MAECYLSELRMFAFGITPKGWAPCNGQLLPINTNQALFSLLGTTYGGDGRTTFALPNLAGRNAMHTGAGYSLGQSGGEAQHTLTVAELPTHIHQAYASSNPPSANTAGGNFWPSSAGNSPYGPQPTGAMAPEALGSAGGSQPHENMSPYLAINICIALVGIFPSRN